MSQNRLWTNSYGLFACVFVLILSLSGCGKGSRTQGFETQNQEIQSSGNPEFQNSRNPEIFANIQANESQASYLVARIRSELSVDGKSLSTNGTLRMKKDDVIQISLVDPFLGAIELGKMEFTRDTVLLLVRVNKEYVEVPYSQVDFLKRANIDFNTLQSLFWNRLFQPGQRDVDPLAFTCTTDSTDSTPSTISINYRDDLLSYRFVTEASSGRINRLEVTDRVDYQYAFNFTYDNFSQFAGKPFPSQLAMHFNTDTQSASLALTLSQTKNSSDWQTRTSIPNGYRKANPELLFKSLVK